MTTMATDIAGLLAGIEENRYDPFLRDVLADALEDAGLPGAEYQRECAKVLRLEDADEIIAGDVLKIAAYYLATRAGEESDYIVLQAVLHRYWGLGLQTMYPMDDMGNWESAGGVLALHFDRYQGMHWYSLEYRASQNGVTLPSWEQLMSLKRGGTE